MSILATGSRLNSGIGIFIYKRLMMFEHRLLVHIGCDYVTRDVTPSRDCLQLSTDGKISISCISVSRYFNIFFDTKSVKIVGNTLQVVIAVISDIV